MSKLRRESAPWIEGDEARVGDEAVVVIGESHLPGMTIVEAALTGAVRTVPTRTMRRPASAAVRGA